MNSATILECLSFHSEKASALQGIDFNGTSDYNADKY